jgi:lipoprotein signal peptidase
MSWQTADDWPWLVVGTVAVVIVFLFLRVFEQTHGYERAANLAVGLILAGGILFLLGWWMNGGGW